MSSSKIRLPAPRIYLTGMMGSGKTTLGKRLAELMRWKFQDTDGLIEKYSDMTVSDIFSEKGQDAFRALESDVLLDVSTRIDCVIALGGGALLTSENINIVLQSGTLVYLRLSGESLNIRFHEDENTERPLLEAVFSQQETEAKEKSFLKLLHDRMPGYERAHITIAMDDLTVDESVELLRNTLAEEGFSFPGRAPGPAPAPR